MHNGSLVVGVDAGGTSTRVAVYSLRGTRVGYGRAGGGNPSAHGLTAAATEVGTALKAALDGLDPASVAASVAGVAGNNPAFGQELKRVWAAHGVPARPRMINDVPVAYAAGTPEPSGTVLLAGTGAAAARVTGHELDSIADGLGWLLADEGSGFWIGRAAAKAVVRALDRAGDSDRPVEGTLVESVVGHFLGDERGPTPRREAERIVRLAQADRMMLAPLSALVSQAAAEGDPMATEIVGQAAGHLAESVARVYQGGPIVLAGSVLTSEGPVRQAVTEILRERWAATVTTARDGAGAAAWLAALPLLSTRESTDLHQAFTEP